MSFQRPSTRRAGPVALMCSVLLAACGEAPPPKPAPLSLQEVTSMLDAPTVPVSWEEAAATFALGGPHTDLQRQLMSERLIGHVVEWRVKVYDVKSEASGYQLISEPADIQVPGAVNMMQVFAFIPAADTESLALLRAAKTGAVLTVRGRVNQLALRAAVVLVPATVSSKGQIQKSDSTNLKP